MSDKPEEGVVSTEQQLAIRAQEDAKAQEVLRQAESVKLMECPLDGAGPRGRHAWLWLWEKLPDGRRVWTDRLQCQHCNEIKRTTRAEGDIILEHQNTEAIHDEPIVGAREDAPNQPGS